MKNRTFKSKKLNWYSTMNFRFINVASGRMDCRQRERRQYEGNVLIALIKVSWWRFLKTIILNCMGQTRLSKDKDFIKFVSNIKYEFNQVVIYAIRFVIWWDNASIDKGDRMRRCYYYSYTPYHDITLLRFCDALGGAVVRCEPKFEITSEILWVTSSQIRSSEDRIRSSLDIVFFGFFD